MKRVINNLLFDTETAKLIYTDTKNSRKTYATENGNFFTTYTNGELQLVTEESVRDLLGTNDIDMYIEVFGQPEEG